MASHLVNQHQQSSFATPINGAAGDATVVLGNDNATVTTYNSHDADATIHVQDSSAAVFNATPAGTAGRKWMTNDAGAVYLYFDTGSAWVEANYLRQATSGVVTITSTTTPQLTVAYDGSNLMTVSVSSAGAVTLNATGASAGFTFSDAITGTSLTLSGDVNLSDGFGLSVGVTRRLAVTSTGVTVTGTFGVSAGISATTGTFTTSVTTPFGAFGTTPASAGAVRIPNATNINARNAANGGDIGIALVDGSDNLSLGAGATSVQAAVKLGLMAAATAGAGSDVYLGGTTQTTIGANGGASALTALPLGYLIAYKGATKIVIPYYNG